MVFLSRGEQLISALSRKIFILKFWPITMVGQDVLLTSSSRCLFTIIDETYIFLFKPCPSLCRLALLLLTLLGMFL